MQDTVRSKVQSLGSKMTKSDAKIARAILSDYPRVGLDSLSEIGAQSGVSAATVLRFIAKLGFDNFPAFQESLKAELQQHFSSPLDRFEKSRFETQAQSPLEHYAGYAAGLMSATAEMVSGYEFGTVSSLLSDSKRPVYVIGGRFSRSIAELFCYGFGQVRGEAKLIDNDSRSMVEVLMDIKRRDILIVFDFRRYQRRLEVFSNYASEIGATVVLVTDQWQSPIRTLADHVLTVPVESPSTFDSGLGALMCVEALVDDVAKKLETQVASRINRFEALYGEFK